MALTKVRGDGVQGMSLLSSSTTLSIDASGRINMPNQVAFSAYQTADYTTTDSVGLTWTATHVNRGSCFNTTNGKFTAPVAGVYQFLFYQLTQNDNSTGDTRMRLNNAVVAGHYGYGSNTTNHKQASIMGCLSLSANDVVHITSHGTHDWNSYHGVFSGFLIG